MIVLAFDGRSLEMAVIFTWFPTWSIIVTVDSLVISSFGVAFSVCITVTVGIFGVFILSGPLILTVRGFVAFIQSDLCIETSLRFLAGIIPKRAYVSQPERMVSASIFHFYMETG